jgi:hypothetical protein
MVTTIACLPVFYVSASEFHSVTCTFSSPTAVTGCFSAEWTADLKIPNTTSRGKAQIKPSPIWWRLLPIKNAAEVYP